MGTSISRILFGLSSLILAIGGLMHAKAFGNTVGAIAASDLPPFYGNSLKALWLIDSATLLVLSVIFGVLTARPVLIGRPLIVLLALIPAATAFCLYKFLGAFLPAHMLATAAVAAILGTLWLRA